MDQAQPPFDEGIEDVVAEITELHDEDRDILWLNYISARKQEFITSSIDTIGAEYLDNRRFWDTQFEREWSIIAERLESGFGLTDDILQIVGADFFKTNEVVFYHDLSDLSEKIHKYKKNSFERKKIARNGKKMYFKYFNSTIVADFILSKTFSYTSKNKFLWDK